MRVILAALALTAWGQAVDEALAPVEYPAIRYYQGALDDRVTRLIHDLQRGGWYVTGTHGEMRHLGNAVGHERDHFGERGTPNQTCLRWKNES